MSCSPPSFTLSFIFLSFISISSFTVHASVPLKNTFKYVNEGGFGPYIVEYGADYRGLPIFASPFQFCFYNTTPNAYTLALRMVFSKLSQSIGQPRKTNRRECNTNLWHDGNLVLAHADGELLQTGIANKAWWG
ncbi:hypothetical protein AAG906_026881 [Vitis piasezkii]